MQSVAAISDIKTLKTKKVLKMKDITVESLAQIIEWYMQEKNVRSVRAFARLLEGKASHQTIQNIIDRKEGTNPTLRTINAIKDLAGVEAKFFNKWIKE